MLSSHRLYLKSAQAAVIKHHRLDGLNNKQLSLPALEVRKSKIKVLTGLVSGENLLPGS